MNLLKKSWNQKSHFKRWLACVFLGVTLVCIAVFFFNNKPSNDTQEIIPPGALFSTQGVGPVVSGLPTRLVIPKIGVDAGFEYVGVTPQGAMDVPKDPIYVGWFDLGPRPGEEGSAVVAGHEGWKNGILVVFDNLHTLQKGDKVYVEDDKGVTTVFAVRELRELGKNEDASIVFNSNDGKAHLNLITCEGVWNADLKSYSNRLVVFTDKVSE
jgi:LPXTG-site transpeptidase (sortase) family protein